jgi:hypothetical protein
MVKPSFMIEGFGSSVKALYPEVEEGTFDSA